MDRLPFPVQLGRGSLEGPFQGAGWENVLIILKHYRAGLAGVLATLRADR